MIEKVRIVIITHDDKYMVRETTPIEIETAKGDLLKWMYEDMVEEEIVPKTTEKGISE